ncbi:MAG: fasciclin domain-containing protein [Cellulophaga sp.]
MKLSKLFKSTSLAIVLLIGANTFAQDKMMKAETKMVGGAEMYPSKDIVSNAVNSKDHTTLVAAVKAADLVKTLQGEGPFTVFAPTNMAFDKLPKGTVETLLMPKSKTTLQKVLTYHVVAGKYSAADIMKAIKMGKGKAEFTTVAGEKLTAMVTKGKVQLKDVAGNVSTVTIADVNQSNGVIHVVDTVVLPMK